MEARIHCRTDLTDKQWQITGKFAPPQKKRPKAETEQVYPRLPDPVGDDVVTPMYSDVHAVTFFGRYVVGFMSGIGDFLKNGDKLRKMR